MKKTLIITIVQFIFLSINAQNFWTSITSKTISTESQISAHNANYLSLNFAAFKNQLFQAPLKTNNAQWSETSIQIPLPNGGFEEYLVFEAPIMEEALANKYPEIKTFILKSKSNRNNYGRASITHKGFNAMLFTENGTLYIDPTSTLNAENYIVYYKKDFYTNKELPTCLTENEETLEDDILENINEVIINHKSSKASNGLFLKTYRLAVSATAEYTQFHGGSVADGLAAIVTTMNRVNGVYEREVAVRLILVDDNDLIVYTDANLDPFQDPSNPGNLLDENRISLNNVIGEENYDIGHVFGRSGSGLAGFGVVCSDFSFNHKANGTTGIPNPIGDPFDVDYVAHEIGHQFRASHTFNGTLGSCGGNRSQNSAYEPGSATTIMGYAGICGAHNTQNNSNDYFHNRSLNQIRNFINDNGESCAVESATGNTIPTIQIITPEGLTIPKSTPFELEALANDQDGDALTYCWEQYDLGPAGAPNSPSGNAPLFRSFSPTTNPIRTFPQISDIANGTTTIGEILPSYTRDMNFKITVRDNVENGAAFIDEEIEVAVDGNSGPFVVTSQSSSVTWQANDTYEVTWDVAGTNQSPINCSEVNVLLSVDGGLTYPYTLINNSINNGSTFVQAPFALTNEARIKVVCADNIFFNVNTSDFEITSDCANQDASINITENVQNAIWCLNASGELDFEVNSPNFLITSYQWYHNNIEISGATNKRLVINNVQNSDGGDYYCELSNGCTSIFTNTASVSVTTNSIIPSISVNNGALVSSIPYGNQWYFEGNLIIGANNQNYLPTQQGTFTVQSIAGSCSASSASYITSVKDLNEVTNIQIIPNPSNGVFRITTQNFNETLNVEVKDILGKRILKSQFVNHKQIDISAFANGLYFVTLNNENYSASYKILKK